LGKVPSLNQFYSSKHWIVRKKAKDKFVAEVLEQLAGYEPFKFSSLVVNLEHNYGYDNDNCIMAIKFALDGLRKHGGVQDDTARFVTKVSIFRNSEIEKNTGKVIFFGECLWY
jgi:restriction endonuclease Mrr